jgi:hypothetical protein
MHTRQIQHFAAMAADDVVELFFFGRSSLLRERTGWGAVVFVGVVVEGGWSGVFEMGDGRFRNSGL